MLHIACQIIRDYQEKNHFELSQHVQSETNWEGWIPVVEDREKSSSQKYSSILLSWAREKPLKAVVCRVLVKLLGFYTVSPLFAEALSTFYTGQSNFSCHFLAFSQIPNSCFTRSKTPSSTHTCWLPGTETNTDITGLSCICINHGRHWQHWSQRWQH